MLFLLFTRPSLSAHFSFYIFNVENTLKRSKVCYKLFGFFEIYRNVKQMFKRNAILNESLHEFGCSLCDFDCEVILQISFFYNLNSIPFKYRHVLCKKSKLFVITSRCSEMQILMAKNRKCNIDSGLIFVLISGFTYVVCIG